jgi:HNH endonuclease
MHHHLAIDVRRRDSRLQQRRVFEDQPRALLRPQHALDRCVVFQIGDHRPIQRRRSPPKKPVPPHSHHHHRLLVVNFVFMALCKCGCGRETALYKSNGSGGVVKGQPMKFIPGHQGYLTTWTPERKAAWAKRMSGRRVPAEQRLKISDAQRARQPRTTGYPSVYAPNHPRAVNGRWIHEHISVAENKIGRMLKPGEVVHHIDGNTLNNHPDNLQVLPSHSAHATLHHAIDPSRRAVPIDPTTGRYVKIT